MRWRHFGVRIAAYSLVLFHVVAALAGFFAPYSFEEQHRDAPNAPPSDIALGLDGWRPRLLVRGSLRDVAVETEIRFFVRGASYSALGVLRSDLHFFGVEPEGKVYLLGTDPLGRDYFSRLLYGGQISLSAGLLGAGLALSTAWILGAVAGYAGGLVDAAIMRAADVFLSLPWLYMLLAARAFLPLDLEPGAAFLIVVVLLGALGWAGPARIIRGIVLGTCQRDFVAAARSAGAGHLRLLWRHILPSTMPVVLTQGTLLVPAYMLAEVTLSFVGLGVSEPRPSWGNMLGGLSVDGWSSFAPGPLAPAIAIILVTCLYQTMLLSSGGSEFHSVGTGSSE